MKKLDQADGLALLTDSGLLFEINRRVLHPLGLALGVKVDDNGAITGAFVLDDRDDPVGTTFAPDVFNEGMAKLVDYMSQRGSEALKVRRENLGFVEQYHD